MKRGCVLAVAAMVSTAAGASPLITDGRQQPISADKPPTGPSAHLAERIAAAADAGLVAQGTAAAWQALVDCRKGDYPGGGSGLFSLPAPGRTNAQSDHCWR